MRPLRVATDLIPIAKFKAHASAVIRRVRKENRPTVITLNGESAAVLISAHEYDRLVYAERVRAAIDRGLADVRAGRVYSTEEIERWADERFGPLKKRKRR